LRRGLRHKTSDVAVVGRFHVRGLAVSKCGRLLEGPKSLVFSTTGWKRGLETGKGKLRTDREITAIRFQLPLFTTFISALVFSKGCVTRAAGI
jgi:hypothetical protein